MTHVVMALWSHFVGRFSVNLDDKCESLFAVIQTNEQGEVGEA